VSDRLQVLSEAMRSFAEATADPQLLLQTIAEQIAEAMGGYCGFALISDDRKLLVPTAFHDRDPEKRALLQRLSPEPVSLDALLPATHALRTGECVSMHSLTEDQLRLRLPRDEDLKAALSLQIKALLFVPLRARGKVIGALNLLRHGEGAQPFQEGDIQLAQSLADQAALALTNARLFEDAPRELAERARFEARLRLLSELSQEFAGATHDYGVLLSLIAQRLAEIVGEVCSLRRNLTKPIDPHTLPATVAALLTP
jgi:GAF domain-containing protein